MWVKESWFFWHALRPVLCCKFKRAQICPVMWRTRSHFRYFYIQVFIVLIGTLPNWSMPPVVCVSVAAENITNSVITRDHFPIIFLPKPFLCWKCYLNLRNYDKNTIFKNKFLLYFLNIKVIYVHHRRNKQAKRGNESHPNPSHRENPH